MRVPLYSISSLPYGKVSVMARPRGGDWLIDEIRALREADVHVLVSLLTFFEELEFELGEEADFCTQEGITFLSLPIVDRSVPSFSDSTFTFLEQLHSHLKKGKHIAVHCRQGLGRAVLIAASLLVLSGFSPEQAFEHLSKARGCSVPETEEQRAWVIAFSQHV